MTRRRETIVAKLLEAADKYLAAHDAIIAIRGQTGKCEYSEKPDHRCGDPGSPPCRWSTLPQDEWCDYCRTRESNRQPLRAAQRRRQELLKTLRRLTRQISQTAPQPLQEKYEPRWNQQLPAMEPPLHTQEVTGSSPVAPTTSQQLTGDDSALTSCPDQGRRSETAPKPLHGGGAQ